MRFHPKGPSFLELCVQALSSTDLGYDLLAPKFDDTPFGTPDEVLDAVAPIYPVRAAHRALRPSGRFVFVTSTLPPKTSRSFWLARGFNAASSMRRCRYWHHPLGRCVERARIRVSADPLPARPTPVVRAVRDG